MNYQIIARKYRPKNFSEVIGQEKITTILQNALKNNKIGQAYLFSGPRGVGKTTTARILVKYLNCETDTGVVPCNQCRSCDDINRGVSLDYLEIDGASNRGIDHIRALNEQLAFASPTGKYRVFVIDEVHMLTHEAFNALLKSLEEPPKKFIFILCTTESYRIPLTIRSRCQQLFYSNIDIHLIEQHLESILKQEGIAYTPESLWGLAKKSEGSIRDAENLLEMVIAFNDEKTITASLVQEVMGETPIDKKYLFLTQLSNKDISKNHQLLAQLVSDGYHLEEFFFNLMDVLSNLVYYKSGVTTPKNLNLNQDEVDQLKGIEKLFSLGELFTLSDILFEFIRTLKNTTHRSTMVEYLLIKLHRYKSLISPGELKENIIKLSQYVLPDEQLDTPRPNPNAVETPDEVIPVHIKAPVSPSTESTKDRNPPPTPAPPPTETASPQEPSPWTSEDYNTLLGIIKGNDTALYRMAAAYQFQKLENGEMVLENAEDLSPERNENFQSLLEEYLSLPASQSHPWLGKYLRQSAGDPKGFKIVVRESIVKSNLEKLKRILPLAEAEDQEENQ